MEVWKISGKCDDRNSIIVDLKTSGSFEVWTCSIKCGKNSREDERESFKFNEYSHRAGYKLLKTSCNADNLGFENIKQQTNFGKGKTLRRTTIQTNYRDQICTVMSYHCFYFYVI